ATAAPTVVSPPPPPASEQPSTGAPPSGFDARALSQAFINVAARLKPSVVTIRVEKRTQADDESGPSNDFFRRFFGGQMPRMPIQRGLGSGFAIDKNGHILTNNHVVEGADRVQVFTTDGREYKGKVVGTDRKDDLAVVKVEGAQLAP